MDSPLIELAPRTLTDTQRNLLYAYLMRVREQVASGWEPHAIMQEALDRDPALGRRDHLELWIYLRLGAEGRIEDLRLLRSSGVLALDRHALASVRQVAPFLPPPARLLDEAQGLGFNYGTRIFLGAGAAGP